MRWLWALSLAGCGLEGGPHWSADDSPSTKQACLFGVLEGPEAGDCRSADLAVAICAQELGAVGLAPVLPALVQVDPMFSRVTGGTSAGTTNLELKAIIVLDADWGNAKTNALCHEMTHLAEGTRNYRHVGWERYYGAIERAQAETAEALRP